MAVGCSLAKVKAFELSGFELVMYTAENINEPPHFNLGDKQRGLDIKVWINTSTVKKLDFKVMRPKNLRTPGSALDSRTTKELGQLIDEHRKELLEQWQAQIHPQQQKDLGRQET